MLVSEVKHLPSSSNGLLQLLIHMGSSSLQLALRKQSRDVEPNSSNLALQEYVAVPTTSEVSLPLV